MNEDLAEHIGRVVVGSGEGASIVVRLEGEWDIVRAAMAFCIASLFEGQEAAGPAKLRLFAFIDRFLFSESVEGVYCLMRRIYLRDIGLKLKDGKVQVSHA